MDRHGTPQDRPAPSPASGDVLDLTRELGAIAALAAEPGRVDDLLARSLEALGQGLPYDLAAVLELQGEELVVRCARGRLADERLRVRAATALRPPAPLCGARGAPHADAGRRG